MDDAELINRFMKKQQLEGWMTRCFKSLEKDKVTYEVSLVLFVHLIGLGFRTFTKLLLLCCLKN